jgi:hypothetical protein
MANPKLVSLDFVPLKGVLERVQKAIDAYHADPAHVDLPILSGVDFTFKASTKVHTGWSISIVVLKFGKTGTEETTEEVLFKYVLPKKRPSVEFAEKVETVPLEEELVKMMAGLGKALKEVRDVKIDGVPFQNASITVQFVITDAFEIGGTVTYQMVTISAGGGRDRSATHSIKLTYGEQPISALPEK